MQTVESIQISGVTTIGATTSAGATTITLNPITFNDAAQLGVNNTIANLTGMIAFGGIKGWGTYDTGGIYEEQISFTGLTVDSSNNVILSGVKHVTAYPPYTETTGIKYPHNGNVVFTFSDNPAFLAAGNIMTLSTANTWAAINTFTFSPIVPTPTVSSQASNKGYIDGLINSIVISGSPLATNTTFGISKLSTSPINTLGICTITIASPAVITFAAHGLVVGDTVQFTTTGALPTGITSSTNYYVLSAGLTTNTFEISAAPAGTPVTTTGTQSGAHTLIVTSPVSVGTNDSRLPTQAQKNAFVGTSGTPSGINPYVTSADISLVVTASSIPRRDASGNLQTVSAINAADVAPKSYVDSVGYRFSSIGTTTSVSPSSNSSGTIGTFTAIPINTLKSNSSIRIRGNIPGNFSGSGIFMTMNINVFLNGVNVGTVAYNNYDGVTANFLPTTIMNFDITVSNTSLTTQNYYSNTNGTLYSPVNAGGSTHVSNTIPVSGVGSGAVSINTALAITPTITYTFTTASSGLGTCTLSAGTFITEYFV